MNKINEIKISTVIDGKKRKIKINNKDDIIKLKEEICNVIDELHKLEKSTKNIYNICCFDCFKIKDNDID